MSALADLQAAMADWALHGRPVPAALAAAHGPPAAAARLSVYRNNTRSSLTEALMAAYPVTTRVVGADFFAALAAAYLEGHPPRAASLLHYGDRLAAFLATWAPAAALVYLPDLARLERAWTLAYHAAEAPTLDPAALTAPGVAERLGSLRLVPHPSLHLVASPWPIAEIWRQHQGEDEPAGIALDAGPSRVAVVRPAAEVRLCDLAPGALALVTALAEGRPLAAALDAAFTADPDFAVERDFAAVLAAGLFTTLEAP
ncbi:DNA-binding domain-containing protein [Caenispirillum bisanense]|uniref:DNA-binding domain-containing protein n=1 Tax=Caenispirillum bisanense TaxID=414052 RepID=A0A286GHG2_9PROT|nr:DNA-binding domain-containing protein [Caenispirillum bisanense]SOD94559.1 Putative DNA-binding domain-containing protein [Caenispirillum bisanense]